MHTVFINTARKKIDNYAEILEIQKETKQLIMLDCPLNTWYDAENGYNRCVVQIEEAIDSYKEINNNYNLIIYADLPSCKQYIELTETENAGLIEKEATVQILYRLFTHCFYQTVYNTLKKNGRIPNETVIIFEENIHKQRQFGDGVALQNAMVSKLLYFMGLPCADDMKAALTKKDSDRAAAYEALIEATNAHRSKGSAAVDDETALFDGIAASYSQQILRMGNSIKSNTLVDHAVRSFADDVEALFIHEGYEIKFTSFVTNRRAGVANKQENAKRDLRLYLYLLDCIYNGSVLTCDTDASGISYKVAKKFPESNDALWDKVILSLKAKKELYRKKEREARSLSGSYTDHALAPVLYAFDHSRFGMDEFGDKERELLLVEHDEESEEKDDPASDTQAQADDPASDVVIEAKNKKSMVVTDKKTAQLLPGYQSFDYTCKTDEMEKDDKASQKKKMGEDDYINKAKALRKHHLQYLNKLKAHVSDSLSNYAGKSMENDPALLPKRKVSVADEDYEGELNDYHYAKAGKVKETQKLGTVKTLSQNAYETAKLEYLRFCAGRSVAVTDIEEQCNWFVTRIGQITASLNMIKAVAVGLLVAIIVLYLPFIVIQSDAIFKTPMTGAIALCSVGIPAVILYVVFTAVSLTQRKRYQELWDEFKEKSDLVLKENTMAAEKYDQLLSVFVPSLRWVYEYKLDVEFYLDCCKLAQAKVNHHILKLHDRVVTIGNILEDLEQDIADPTGQMPDKNKLDYNVPYCTNGMNREFYSIIDKSLVDSLRK